MRLYDVAVESIYIYGAEAWRMKKSDRGRVEAVAMSVLERSAGKTRLGKV